MGWKTRLLTLILDVQILIGAVIAELDVQVVRQNATGKGVVVFSNITLQPCGGSSYGFLVEAPIGGYNIYCLMELHSTTAVLVLG
ncbi:hypothetical protein TWF703_002190 [Orbilia oligospora]|uniref:Uncharacterized protein n=1 Tax=Orbilia oligospora TaxID=2813651 RepID=A0A7C8JUY7_ORBOL|nr:hypothetical protein TWF703_002190 [Orbilia oligospora]